MAREPRVWEPRVREPRVRESRVWESRVRERKVRYWRVRLVWAAIAILCVGSLAGCRGLEITSTWRTHEAAVDGVPGEWQGLTTYVESPNSAIGLINDDEYLYLCFSTPVKSLAAQVLHQGLTVWFDADGGKDKVFGVHCPLGGMPRMTDSTRMGGRTGAPGVMGAPGTSGAPGDPRTSGEMPERETAGKAIAGKGEVLRGFDDATKQIEMIGPGKGERIVLASDETRGVEVKMGNQAGRLVYELKVPLRVSEAHPYAIGADAAGELGIGFETPAVEMEAMGERPERGEMPGGVGGGMPGGGPEGGGGFEGGPGGGPGGMGGRGGPQGAAADTRGFEIWCKARLASGS